jgi:hypothetical protein
MPALLHSLDPVAEARREAAKQLQRDLEQQIEEKRRRKVTKKLGLISFKNEG